MTDTQKATLTVHIHLSMQSVVVDNIIWPFSDVGSGVTDRLEAQRKLKTTYVEPIIEIARMTARAPIININHDPRFVAAGSEEAKKVEHNLTGFHAMGAYVALELRVRGCVVTHRFSFWSKMACQLKQSSTGIHMLSWETHGDGDEHIRLWRAFAVYEKQLFTEKMVTVCFMDHNKIKEWDDNIKAPVLNRQEFVDIWEDKVELTCQWEWTLRHGLMLKAEKMMKHYVPALCTHVVQTVYM